MPRRNSRAVLFGNFGSSNIGNECTLTATVEAIRTYRPDAQVLVACSNPEQASRIHGVRTASIVAPFVRKRTGKASRRDSVVGRLLYALVVRGPVELWDLWRLFGILRDSAVLVVPGTGVLSDFACRPLQMPYELSKWTFVARICGVPIKILSAGAGPINAPLSGWFIKAALRRAKFRSYRDEHSKKVLSAAGFDSSGDPVYPDLAFGLPRALFVRQRPSKGTRLSVAIGVMDYGRGSSGQDNTEHLQYLEQIADLVETLLAMGHVVRLIVGDYVHDDQPRRELVDLLSARGLTEAADGLLVPQIASLESLLAELARSDLVVSSRFHNILLALILGVPAISVSYDPKSDYLLEGAGLGRFAHSLRSWSVAEIVDDVRQLSATMDEVRVRIDRFVEESRNRLDAQFRRVFGKP